MSTQKLLSSVQFRTVPSMIRNCLRNAAAQSNPPTFRSIKPVVLATNLIKSSFEKGLINKARVLFDEMTERDVVVWTAMVEGYTSSNHHHSAWNVFCQMIRSEMEPNDFTFSSVLKACRRMKSLSCGSSVHCLAIKLGLQGSLYVENALMDMYATCCSSMDNACMIFRDLDDKSDVSWTTLITGFTHRGDGDSALFVFRQMILVSSRLHLFFLIDTRQHLYHNSTWL